MQTWSPANVVSGGMPDTVQAGRTTATEPPASALWNTALHYNDIAEEARGAAIVVAVQGAEAKAVLVDSFVGTSDGIAFGTRVGI